MLVNRNNWTARVDVFVLEVVNGMGNLGSKLTADQPEKGGGMVGNVTRLAALSRTYRCCHVQSTWVGLKY